MKRALFLLLIVLNMTSIAQEKLPDWFLNPPVSPDHSCVYSIGISDPGMNKNDASDQAMARAKMVLCWLWEERKPLLENTVTEVYNNEFETVSRDVLTKYFLNANYETLCTYFTNHNEAIVLIKYSFIERPNCTISDSLQIKTLCSLFVSQDNESFSKNLEEIAKYSLAKTDLIQLYYNFNSSSNDSIISSFERVFRFKPEEFEEMKKLHPNAEFSESSPNQGYIKFNSTLGNLKLNYANQKPIAISASKQLEFPNSIKSSKALKNGLWCAYRNAFNEEGSKILNEYTDNSQPSTLIIPASIGINNNNLEVEFRATNYGENFFTITYPEDVDTRIPVTTQKKSNRFALVVGNEDYSSYQQGLSTEVNVDFAVNDATIFHQYAIKTLGVPAENAFLLTNARAMDMHKAIEKMSLLAKSLNGKAEIIFYYAGHGLPDENKEPFLMPVDVSGNDIQFGIKQKDLFAKLTQYPTQRVTVILDACFSGGARNQGLVAARGVKINPKQEPLTGNLVVFSASSGEQASLPYSEKQHGIFTYYLLKKIQETQGNITYFELSNSLQEQVGVKSLLINNREQTPQTNVSVGVGEEWKNWSLK